MKTMRDYMNIVLFEEINFRNLSGGWVEVEVADFRKAAIALHITSLAVSDLAVGEKRKFFMVVNAMEPVLLMVVEGLGSMKVTGTASLRDNNTPDSGWTRYVVDLFKQLHPSTEVIYNGHPLFDLSGEPLA